MAGVAAINLVGETITAILKARRDLLASDNLLAPVPNAVDITHLSLGKLVTAAAPTTGLTVTCYQIGASDQPANFSKVPGEPKRPEIALELHYLLASWSGKAEEEQAVLAWAMLELSGHQMLDRSLLQGGDVWDREEAVQLAPKPMAADELYRLWDATGQKMRLSAAYTARVIRLRGPRSADAGPVVASRMGFAPSDPLTVGEPA